MTVVIDANLVLRWLQNEAGGDQVVRMIQTHATNDVIVVPDLLFYEVTNVLLQGIRRGQLTQDMVEGMLTQLNELPLTRSAGLIDQRQALRTAAALSLPAAYDGQYIALAEELDAELWTGDRRLYEAAREDHPRVQLV